MGTGQLLIIQAGFWLSGTVFTRQMEKRERFQLRFVMFVLIAIAQGIVFYYTWGGRAAMTVAGRGLSFLMMLLALWSCWKVHWTAAIYDAIWGVSLWQLVLELWKMIRSLYPHVFIEHSFFDILLVLALYTFSYEICAHTIAVWMPRDRRGKLGPRQLSSALLIFLIVQILAFSPTLNEYTTYSADWKFLYLSQMMCIVILYLQNELFKKGEIKQELELMNLLLKKEQEQYQLTK